jgi:hypothetical protein
MADLGEKSVPYYGTTIRLDQLERISGAQRQALCTISGRKYRRVRYGHETFTTFARSRPCADCCALLGQFHEVGCPAEQCPRCAGRRAACGCSSEPPPRPGQMGDGYGSECHLLRYLGRHRQHFDQRVRETVSCDAVCWLDYPPDPRREWPDAEWKGLEFLREHERDAAALKSDWEQFWPQRGEPPNWDAVAQIRVAGAEEWLLVEAKAHLGEIRSHCSAKPEGGRAQIEAAMHRTKQALGVPADRDWLKGYYQYCNRVAILHFLNQHPIPTRLLFVYFTGDRAALGQCCPGSEAGWTDALRQQAEHVGLPPDHGLKDRIHRLFLPVCPPAEKPEETCELRRET